MKTHVQKDIPSLITAELEREKSEGDRIVHVNNPTRSVYPKAPKMIPNARQV